MKKRKSRDKPGKARTIVTVIAVVLVALLAASLLGSLGGLISDSSGGGGSGSSGSNTQKPDDDTSGGDLEVPEESVRGSGLYAEAEGVLNYTYSGDTSVSGFDFGFNPGVTSSNVNWSVPTSVDGDACWEIGRINVTETETNIATFTPVSQSGNKYVFETDIYWRGTSGQFVTDSSTCWLGRYQFIDSNNQALDIFWHTDSDGNLSLSDHNNYSNNYVTIPLGEWSNLRIEIYDSLVHFYLNGELKSEIDTTIFAQGYDNLSGGFTAFKIENRCYLKDILYYLDNTYISCVEN